MNLWKIQKVRVAAKVLMRGRRIMNGSFFVVSPEYPVPNSVLLLNLLNESHDYVPVERMKRVALLNKYQIIFVKLPAEKTSEEPSGIPRKRIQVLLPTGQELKGTISVDLPEENRRVLDFMNLRAPFFLLRDRKELYIVNRSMIQEVHPLEAG